MKQTDMTEADYAKLDELLTKTTPGITNIPGVFAREKQRKSAMAA
jgi:hypothetical protein